MQGNSPHRGFKSAKPQFGVFGSDRGFRKFPEFGVKTEIPAELGWPSNALASAGMFGASNTHDSLNFNKRYSNAAPLFPEPEWLDRSTGLASRLLWARAIKTLQFFHGVAKGVKDKKTGYIVRILPPSSIDTARAKIAKGETPNASEERKLTRADRRNAHHRLVTLVKTRARRLMIEARDKGETLSQEQAMALAEEQYCTNLALQKEHGFSIDALLYVLGDNIR